jgi:hypothetical protein
MVVGRRVPRRYSFRSLPKRRELTCSREMIDSVPQEVHIAALPGNAGQAFRDRLFQPFVVIRDHELDAVETTLLEPHQEGAPARAAFPIGKLNNTCRRPSQSMPMAINTAWLWMTPSMRTFS